MRRRASTRYSLGVCRHDAAVSFAIAAVLSVRFVAKSREITSTVTVEPVPVVSSKLYVSVCSGVAAVRERTPIAWSS